MPKAFLRLKKLPVALAALTLVVQVAAPLPAMAAPRVVKPPKLTDTCQPLRKPFSAIKNYRFNKTIEGALIGAAAGFLVGLVLNALERQRYDQNGRPIPKSTNVLATTLAGAAAGGAIGNVQAREEQEKRRTELQAALAKDGEAVSASYSPLAQQLLDLGNCRRAQLFTVEQSIQSKLYDGDEGLKRIALIERWIAADDALIQKASKTQTATITRFASAAEVADGKDAKAVKADTTVLARAQADSVGYQGSVDTDYATSADGVPSGVTATPEPELPVIATYTVSAPKGARLRAQPAESAEVVAVIAKGAKVDATPTASQDWLKISWNGRDGYVHRSVLSARGEAAVFSAAARPQKRQRPKGSSVEILKMHATRAKVKTPRDQVKRAVATTNDVKLAYTFDKSATQRAVVSVRTLATAAKSSSS